MGMAVAAATSGDRQQMTDYEGERPVVLVIGSSFSEAGIDPDVLAEAFGSAGRAGAVQRLAVGGAPHLERLHYLKEYLARAKQAPQLVLFEIAGGYDSGPLYQVHQMRFSDRMVAMMDGSSAWWALRWLASADGLSLFQRFTLGSEILGQLALHVSRIEFLWNSAPPARALPRMTAAGRRRRRASPMTILPSCSSKWRPRGI
jgi:hypothetical protein